MASEVALALEKLRARKPLVLCLTNDVAQTLTADVLLAVGAAPLMVKERRDLAEALPKSDALLCNLGTLSDSWLPLIHEAMAIAQGLKIPMVIDPVGAHFTDYPLRMSRALIDQGRPQGVRGNVAEILALFGEDALGQGVVSESFVIPERFSDRLPNGVVVLATGPIDWILARNRCEKIYGGSPMATKSTAVGCSQGAVLAALFATLDDHALAARCCSVLFKKVGEKAEISAAGPASWLVHFLDGLATWRS